MTKKISKVIVYYEDGTYEEIKASFNDSPYKQNTPNVNPSPVIPNPYNPPWIVTCGTGSVPLQSHYSFTSMGNFAPDNKYSITSTGNGNVDLSK